MFPCMFTQGNNRCVPLLPTTVVVKLRSFVPAEPSQSPTEKSLCESLWWQHLQEMSADSLTHNLVVPAKLRKGHCISQAKRKRKTSSSYCPGVTIVPPLDINELDVFILSFSLWGFASLGRKREYTTATVAFETRLSRFIYYSYLLLLQIFFNISFILHKDFT